MVQGANYMLAPFSIQMEIMSREIKRLSLKRKVMLEKEVEKCKLIRESKGLTVYQMSKIVGVSVMAIYNFEKGLNDSLTIYLYYKEIL